MCNLKRKATLWGWMIIFATAILLRGQVLCYGLEPQQRKMMTGQQFFEELVKTAKANTSYKLRAAEVKGEIKPLARKILRAAEISKVVFERDISIDETTFTDTLSFSDCIFMGAVEIKHSHFLKGVQFVNCVFEDEFLFYDNLVGVSLQQRSSFWRSTFKKDINFLGSEFFTNVDFTKCRFQADVLFGGYPKDEFPAFYEGKQDNETKRAAFRKPVYFSESIFKGKASFPYTEFSDADFKETVFEYPVRFSKTKFKGSTDFSRAIFQSYADFERAIFYPDQSREGRGGETPDTANFYKASFKEDVSFNKSIFLIDADFKRASFGQRLCLINSLFTRKVNFEACVLGKELLGSQINDLGRIKREIAFYKFNERWKKLITGVAEDWQAQRAIWEKIKARGDPSPEVKKEISTYLEKKFGRCGTHSQKSSDVFPDKKDLRETLEMWRGKEAYIGETSFTIIDQGHLSCERSQFSFIGSRFDGKVDFRGGQFNEADFSSGEIMTVFHSGADFSEAFFEKIVMEGTVFLEKVHLPLEKIFSESGMISRNLTIDDLLLPLHRGLRNRDDHIRGREEKLRDLYTQLEPIFRKNSQILEANEMALRAAWLNLILRDGKEKLASLFILIALPIRNLLVAMLAFNLYFYLCLVAKKSIKARTSESSFKPGKLPLVYVSSEDLHDGVIDRIQTPEGEKKIVRPRKWQTYSWPLFLCLGTFFAIVSLGSEYVTDEESCLKKMKILRMAGFILLPLLAYSLAKRSEGLHAIATFI